MAKISRAKRLRLELAEAEAGEKFVALKAERDKNTCKTCGRPKPPSASLQKKIDAARAELRAARVAVREARQP